MAKNVFQVHGVDRKEKALWCRRLTRENWLKVLHETVEPCAGSGRSNESQEVQSEAIPVEPLGPKNQRVVLRP